MLTVLIRPQLNCGSTFRKRWRHGKAIVFEIKVENQTAGAAGVFKFLLFKERLKSSFFLRVISK